MNSSRRNFLKKAGMIAVSAFALNALEAFKISAHIASPIKEFGIQLWTVRQDMAKDPKGVLKQLAADGYKQIESFSSGPSGDIFWGMTAYDFKNYCDSIGLTCISAHCESDYTLDEKLTDEFKQLVDDAAGIGMKYLLNPYMVQLKTIDEFKRAAEGFNKQGDICKQAGLKFGYHNHNYSFRKIAGVFPQDVMMAKYRSFFGRF